MTVKQNIFYAISTYEVEPQAAIGRCFTCIDNNNNSTNKIFIYSWLQIKNSLS